MTSIFDTLISSTLDTLRWTWSLITLEEVWYKNYFYGLILISLVVWLLEILFPWRIKQDVIRKDFWMDGFYMFFNFFLFSIAISGFYEVFGVIMNGFNIQMNSLAIINISEMPVWLGILLFFILSDFVQWFTHILLHRIPAFWRFHKVHHSVKEMGFAAHLRYHWMENILYKPLKTLVVMVLGGAEPQYAYFVHFVAIAIGHLNHANVRITWGPFKYFFNNSVMHLYHHAKNLPEDRRYGVNFGISLSVWDYIFGTNYIPQSKKGDYELGFPKDENFPKTFWKQLIYGFRKGD